MRPYCTFGAFAAIKRIGETVVPTDAERAQIDEYLLRGRSVIDGSTRRQFDPEKQIRMYSMPSRYVDLRQRAFPRDDLMLDRDLLEVIRVQVGLNNAQINTLEVVPSDMNARVETLALANVAGADEYGDAPRIAVGDILVIEQEYCPVVVVDPLLNTARIQRGMFETLAMPHAAGTAICKLSLVPLVPGIDFVPLDFNIRPIIGLRIVYPATWAGRFTGAAWRYRYPQIFVTGLWGFHDQPQRAWVDTLATVPQGGLSVSAQELIINPALRDDNGVLAWQDGFLYRIGDEMLWGGAITTVQPTSTMALARHKQGTTAVAHAEGEPIYRFDVLHDVIEANLDIAKTLRDADAAVGGRQGVSDMSTGVALGWGTDTTKTINRLTRSLL